jgi:hypothetical protein
VEEVQEGNTHGRKKTIHVGQEACANTIRPTRPICPFHPSHLSHPSLSRI